MQRGIFLFLLCTFAFKGFSQASANAYATATIMTPVGIDETVDVVNKLEFLSVQSVAAKKSNAQPAEKNVEVASFKIVGASINSYSLTFASEAISLSTSHSKTSLLLDHLQVRSTEAENFRLCGKTALKKGLQSGTYTNTTPLDIIIHFN